MPLSCAAPGRSLPTSGPTRSTSTRPGSSALITPRTKAIVAVHYAGVGCEMDAILDIAGRHGLAVVEDNAHGLFGKYRGRYLGTFGALATLSFHETKNFTCGEGGALLINDPALIERAEIIREKGTNRSRFFRGQVDKYTWVISAPATCPPTPGGLSYWPSSKRSERIQATRKTDLGTYHEGLAGWAAGARRAPAACPRRLPAVLSHVLPAAALARGAPEALIGHLKERGILAVFHYLPLHLSEMGKRFGGKPGDCPVTEDVSERLIRLPFYNNLDGESQERVIRAIREFPWDQKR